MGCQDSGGRQLSADSILLEEPAFEVYVNAIGASQTRWMSAVSLLESRLVASSRKGPGGWLALVSLVAELGITVAAFTPDQAERAHAAWTRFGKGRHPARLNLGDYCSYALAQETGEPLL